MRIPALMALLLAGAAPTPADDGVTSLTAGRAVERELAAGEEHVFRLALGAGEALKLTVDQLGADVLVELRRASADPLVEDDEAKHHYGRELLLWLAPASDAIDVVVRAKSVSAPGSRYRLMPSVIEARAGLAETFRAYQQGVALARDAPAGSSPSGTQALELLTRAHEGWTRLEQEELAAAASGALGRLLALKLHQPEDALARLDDAAAVYARLGLPSESAQTLITVGDAHLRLGQADDARSAYERAYAFGAEIDPVNRAIIEDDLASVAHRTGDLDLAVAFSRRAIETFRAAGARRDEGIALERLAQSYQKLRRFDEALRAMNEAIDIGRHYGKEDDVATTMVLLGSLHLNAGDDDAALEAYRKALELFKGQPPSRIGAHLSIGRVHNRRGQYRTAREELEPALERIPQQLREFWAATASELGVSLAHDGEPERALDLQKRALEIVHAGQSRYNELAVMRDLVGTYRILGDLASAESTAARAWEIAIAIPGRPLDAIVLRERASNARQAGDLPRALEYLLEAIELNDSGRGRVRAQALRTAFGAATSVYYTDAIDVEMQLHAQAPLAGHDRSAFELFERGAARNLRDLIVEAQVDVRAGVDPALRDEEGRLQKQFAAQDTALRALGRGPGMQAQTARLEQELDDLLRRLTVLDAGIRASQPRYAALVRPTPLSADDTQRLLTEDTLLLALSLDAKHGWGWAITSSSLRAFPLPPVAEVEELVRKFHAGLQARLAAADRPGAAVVRADAQLARDAAALSDAVLGPVALELRGSWRGRRLAIIAPGALEYVPFAALPAPQPQGGDAALARPWLVDDHELVQLPSAAVLALLRNEAAARPPSERRVAVLADPVYGADDPRVRRATSGAPAPGAPAARGADVQALVRGVDDAAGARSGFIRLPFSRNEARAIAELAPAGRVLQALDFSANLETMRGPAVGAARIVHLAGHGILNSARPERSGLVLSLVDTHGRAQEGVLRLHDVYNLKLSAELVVLSGCQTGLGKQMASEGLVGLTQAFMYAGAARVMASLWQVDDLATSELMRRFYKHFLSGKTAAAALRAAQQEMRAQPRWRSPLYWAAFTLVGDWR